MSGRQRKANFLTKNLGKLVEKTGSKGLDSFIEIAAGPAKSKGTAKPSAAKATDWSSRA